MARAPSDRCLRDPLCPPCDRPTEIRPIARRRFLKPQDPRSNRPRINDYIRVRSVRLIDENEEMIGVVDTDEAKRMAARAGLDLVEVSPDSDPPVCRILDYGKFRYDQAKKDRANRAKSKGHELKEVRFGRSMKIDPHDAMIRTNQARKFLMDGHKVQIVMTYRGREMMHRERGMKKANDVIEHLADISKVEMSPRQAGRRLTILLAPDKAKISRIKSAAASAAKAESADAAELKDPPSQVPVVDPPAPPIQEPAADAVDTGDQNTVKNGTADDAKA